MSSKGMSPKADEPICFHSPSSPLLQLHLGQFSHGLIYQHLRTPLHDVPPGQHPKVQGPQAGLLEASQVVRRLQPEQARLLPNRYSDAHADRLGSQEGH